jgi:hypothetical protein
LGRGDRTDTKGAANDRKRFDVRGRQQNAVVTMPMELFAGRAAIRVGLNGKGPLGEPEALLVFGPGEAKLELKERLSRSKALTERSVEIETTDKLTEPQIVAKVKEHFGIDR